MSEKTGQNDGGSSKSILKPPRQKPKQKTFQWDEVNIMQTYHPADKTYGHMKIDEPKTPYVYEGAENAAITYGASFTAEELAARLAAAAEGTEDKSRSSIEHLDPEEQAHQKAFRDKRKAHYNEFLAAKMAKERLQNPDDSDNDDELDQAVEEAARNARLNAAMSRNARASDRCSESSSSGRQRSNSPKDRRTNQRR